MIEVWFYLWTERRVDKVKSPQILFEPAKQTSSWREESTHKHQSSTDLLVFKGEFTQKYSGFKWGLNCAAVILTERDEGFESSSQRKQETQRHFKGENHWRFQCRESDDGLCLACWEAPLHTFHWNFFTGVEWNYREKSFQSKNNFCFSLLTDKETLAAFPKKEQRRWPFDLWGWIKKTNPIQSKSLFGPTGFYIHYSV